MVKFTFEVGDWLNVQENSQGLKITTNDNCGNEIELNVSLGLMFRKKWIKQFKKDIAKLDAQQKGDEQ